MTSRGWEYKTWDLSAPQKILSKGFLNFEEFKCFLAMLSLCSLWSVLLIYAFDSSNTLEFAPTRTWATLQSSALAWDNVPIITAGTFHGDLKARATSQQNSICGWIDGNGGTRLYLPIISLALTFRFET
jgi:hypothetical protein